jgi:hypothetical protein
MLKDRAEVSCSSCHSNKKWHMPRGGGWTDGVQLELSVSWSICPCLDRQVSDKEKGGCVMATGNKRNGIALLGRISIYKQENKENVFLLLLSFVLTHFSEALWFMWKDMAIQ